jgi:small subunit ribosomal protein S20
VRRLLEKKDAKGASAVLPATFSLIDRSAKWGIIKKNTAARYKSRITARLKALAQPA